MKKNQIITLPHKNGLFFIFFTIAICCCNMAFAQRSPPWHTPFQSIDPQIQFLDFPQQLRILGFLAVLSLLPFAVIMMTSFTRLTIIFYFLRQALGTVQTPSSQIIIGLSLILTVFIMHPVIEEVHKKAFVPYMNHEFKNEPDVLYGIKGEDALLLERTWIPIRGFLLQHTRESDLLLFLDIAHVHLPTLESDDGESERADLSAIPWYCVIPSFCLSELRIAFMMGFLLFLPFLIIDMVVASILMSMGMMMLPPAILSMPFKILLFIMVDGWQLIIQQMVNGYNLN